MTSYRRQQQMKNEHKLRKAGKWLFAVYGVMLIGLVGGFFWWA